MVQPCIWFKKEQSQFSIGQTEQSLTCSIMEKPHTGLDECPRILLLCLRARSYALWHWWVVQTSNNLGRRWKTWLANSDRNKCCEKHVERKLGEPFMNGKWETKLPLFSSSNSHTTSDEPSSLSKRKPNEENGEGKEKAAFKRAKSCYSGTRL